MIIKCKMCGAPCNIGDQSQKLFTCDFCHTQQTVCSFDDDKKVNLNERANQYRRAGDFDKAIELFEKVLALDSNDPDIYWNIALCRYGITYVKDPVTGEQKPTVNRTQNKAIISDDAYIKATELSSGLQKDYYVKAANEIDAINKKILSIADKEKPYDVFISYKETENNSKKRTRDSILANQLYDQLRREGFNVFFSRITLKEKAGSEYEPIIYNALRTSKIMLVVSTSKENMVAPWVKNEWSRFLTMMNSDSNKTLIPVYQDIDPYEDFPDELSLYQGLDLKELSTVPELILTIRKKLELVKKSATQEKTIIINENSPDQIKNYLRRIELFLEDGDFESADEYVEKVLDIDSECSLAYFYKAMSDLKFKTFSRINEKILENKNYIKARRFETNKTKELYSSLPEKFEKDKENEPIIIDAAIDGIQNEWEMHIEKFKLEYDKVNKKIENNNNFIRDVRKIVKSENVPSLFDKLFWLALFIFLAFFIVSMNAANNYDDILIIFILPYLSFILTYFAPSILAMFYYIKDRKLTDYGILKRIGTILLGPINGIMILTYKLGEFEHKQNRKYELFKEASNKKFENEVLVAQKQHLLEANKELSNFKFISDEFIANLAIEKAEELDCACNTERILDKVKQMEIPFKGDSTYLNMLIKHKK